jgi:hypothetical protein
MGVDQTNLKKRIFCHRGFWTSKDEQNSLVAISRATTAGYGIETDIRDTLGSIALSHDPVRAPNLVIENLASAAVPIALNIKADGLLGLDNLHLREILSFSGSFVFDASVPEMLRYKRAELPHALRLSEYERDLPWKSEFVWLDAFDSDWWIEGEMLKRLSNDHFVIVVSPELHQREYAQVWNQVLDEMSSGNHNIAICTDFPDEFYGMAR